MQRSIHVTWILSIRPYRQQTSATCWIRPTPTSLLWQPGYGAPLEHESPPRCTPWRHLNWDAHLDRAVPAGWEAGADSAALAESGVAADTLVVGAAAWRRGRTETSGTAEAPAVVADAGAEAGGQVAGWGGGWRGWWGGDNAGGGHHGRGAHWGRHHGRHHRGNDGGAVGGCVGDRADENTGNDGVNVEFTLHAVDDGCLQHSPRRLRMQGWQMTP